MTRRELNFQTMGEGVEQKFADFNQVWAGNVVFTAGVGKHVEHMSAIRVNATKQQNAKDISGVIHDKDMLKLLMIETIVRTIAGICAYAENINDNELKESVHYSPSQLKTMTDGRFVSAATKVKDVAVDYKAEIEAYGVSEAMITLLTNDILSYIDISRRPKSMRSEARTITGNLKKTVQTMNSFLKNTMDALVKSNYLNSDFAISYFNSRKVYDLGKNGTILRGTVTDLNGHPIRKCVVELMNYPTPGVNTLRITNNKGHYAFKRLSLEDATIRFRAVNYAVVEFERTLVQDKENDFDVQLTPVPAAVPVFA